MFYASYGCVLENRYQLARFFTFNFMLSPFVRLLEWWWYGSSFVALSSGHIINVLTGTPSKNKQRLFMVSSWPMRLLLLAFNPIGDCSFTYARIRFIGVTAALAMFWYWLNIACSPHCACSPYDCQLWVNATSLSLDFDFWCGLNVCIERTT